LCASLWKNKKCFDTVDARCKHEEYLHLVGSLYNISNYSLYSYDLGFKKQNRTVPYKIPSILCLFSAFGK
jgi:hypothetical protein